MASKKKASEGIALLSMYGDEDDEMEGAEEQDENLRDEVPSITSDVVMLKGGDDLGAFGNENASEKLEERGTTSMSPNKLFNYSILSATASPLLSRMSPQLPQQTVGLDLKWAHIQKNRLTIVDYGHEEGAISPEAEDGEIVATGRVMYGEQLQTSDGEFWDNRSPRSARPTTPTTQATTPQLLDSIDQPESDTMNCEINASESAETGDTVMVSAEEQRDMDPLDKFLPPPPKEKCSEELQEKIIKFLTLKKTAGRSFNAEVRNKKEYRNPDFLLHAVTYQNIDQIGSCFSKDVFDPHGYDKSDFYDEIEADIRREVERREQEKKKNQKIDFVSGGPQQGNVIPTPKINTPIPGLTGVAGGVTNVTPVAVDVAARDGRHNKKSKWDKVDVDQRNFNLAGGQETLPALSAHAALISAAKAGSGYSAFA
ncbi:hypothetical protein F511_01877 [Dorcoceras hygrometricum]|uniref:SAP30-binding protein n=1 Tax=Dorcoceras hygrometricum TaxID=472368 RepID=A0A2Z7CXL4_9LAMI|nr:hypothetical protein F511_01877 [Dorcoceras hygrometricum]